MRSEPVALCLFWLTVLVGVTLLCSVSDASTNEKPVPRFEWSPIPDSIAPVVGEVTFGYLIVPENRQDPQDVRTIRLPVMIGKCRSPIPKPDPILFTVGGPGVLSTMRGGRDLTQLIYLDERDFIYFEQRGAAYAEPALTALEIDSVYADAIGKRRNGLPRAEDVAAAAARLGERLSSEGIDPAAYNLMETAADVADLRRVLGIKEWNLYGVSYSCRLMLEVARNHPEGIRSMILDSPLPPDVGWDETSVENYWRTLHRLFEDCRRDTTIERAFPDLEQRFLRLLEETNAEPILVSIQHPLTQQEVNVRIDGVGIFQCAAHYIGNGQHIYGFPCMADQLCDRVPEMLSYLVSERLSVPPYAWGMRYSIWCSAESPFESLERVRRHEGVPPALQNVVWAVVTPQVCDAWQSGILDEVVNEPVRTSIPALVTNGQYDPDTPPEWGRRLCETLPNGHHFIFPGQSHLPLFQHPCGKPLAQAFLNNPLTRPDSSCLEAKPFRFYSGD